MITKFSTVYAGYIDFPDLGQSATPVNERRFSNQELATVFSKAEAIAKTLDSLGYHSLWIGEHHFQHEGYECIPNILMLALHLSYKTKKLKIGCGVNITPMWHPLRLAEDFATADILTNGRILFGVGRGYHTREVETFGAPLLDQAANRELFEEQVDIIFKAFNNESFSHQGKHYTIPARVSYRGYDLEEITLVPRPLFPVECYQPIVSANQRGMDFMVKHNIKGFVDCGAALLENNPVKAYQNAWARAGKQLALGENLQFTLHFHLANSREQAIREITPAYEEHVKVLAPLGFMPDLTPTQLKVIDQRGGWEAVNIPTLEDNMQQGSWFVGTPDEFIDFLKKLEKKFPGLEHISLNHPIGTSESMMLEQFQMFAENVMPEFTCKKIMCDA